MPAVSKQENQPDITPRCWQLAELKFDSRLRQLSNQKNTLTLEPKVSALLCYLLVSPGHFASHQQLLNHVWRGRIVSDSAVQRAISQLRKAFAQLLPGQVVVHTLNKSGYQLEIAANPIPDAIAAIAVNSITSQRLHINQSLFWLLLLPVIATLFWLYSPTTLQQALTAVPVSSLPGLEYSLTGSRDGKLLYLHHLQNRTEVVLQEGDLIQRIYTTKNVNLAAISPDGKQIAMRLQQAPCQIALASVSDNIISEELTPLFNCTADSQLRLFWSPDQSGLYYRQRLDKSRPYQWYFYNFASKQHSQLSLNPDVIGSNGDLAMALSSDSERFAIARYKSAQQTVLIIFQRNSLQLLSSTILPVPIQAIAWHSEQQLILASAEQLYRFDLRTQRLSLLHHAGDYINSMVLNDNELHYAVSRQYGDIWQYNLMNGSAEQLHSSSRHDAMPRLSPDQTKLAFLSTRQGGYQIWLSHNGQVPRVLAEIKPTPGFVRLSWSADSRYLYYSQQSAAYRVDSNSGYTQKIVDSNRKVFNVYSDDNGGLLYSSSLSGDWQLWYFNPLTQKHQQLTTTGGYSGAVVKNQLFYSKYHQDGLWLRNLDTAEEQLLIADFDKINWLNWQLSGNNIIFYRPRESAGGAAGIWRYSLSDNSQQLVWPEEDDFIPQFQLNGQILLLVKRKTVGGDIYRLNIE